MKPPVIDLGRTPAQILEDRIRSDAASIRRNWDHMLPDGPPGRRIGSGSKSAGILTTNSHGEKRHYDHAVMPKAKRLDGLTFHAEDADLALARASDIDALTRIVSLRRYVTECLNGWCRVIIEDRNITSDAVPDGSDATAMCAFIERHALWMGPQDFALDAADELEELAAAVAAIADPPKRERHYIGRCTFVIEGDIPDVHDRSCRGRVTMPIGGDDDTATCDRCEQSGPVAWWEEVLTLTPQWWVASGPELARILTQRMAVTVDERTIRRWRTSGKIHAIEPFGPQTYAPRFDVRAVLTEVATFDHECILCGRSMTRASDLCLACLSTTSTAKPRRAETPAYVIGTVALAEPAVLACDLRERTRCQWSDLPVTWCACGRHG